MRKEEMVKKVFSEPVKIPPSELVQKEFSVVLRGFDREAVKRYLEEVSIEYERLLEKYRKLGEDARKLEGQVKEYRNMEQTIKNALISSQRFGEKLIDDARKSAEAIINEAKREAEKIKKHAQDSVAKTRESSREIEQRREEMIKKFRRIIQEEFEFLESIEKSIGQ